MLSVVDPSSLAVGLNPGNNNRRAHMRTRMAARMARLSQTGEDVVVALQDDVVEWESLRPARMRMSVPK